MAPAERNGFTVIELLTVIIVLGILFVIAAGALSRAKGKALSTQCVSNLKQYGIALHSFVSEHSEYPLKYNPASVIKEDHDGNVWISLSKHGLSSDLREGRNVHTCPSAAQQKLGTNPEGRTVSPYGYNIWGLGSLQEHAPLGLGGLRREGRYLFDPVPESTVARPAEMVTFGDAVSGWNQVFADGSPGFSRSPKAKDYSGSTSRVPTRHAGQLMVLFADGHVKPLSLHHLFQDQSDAALRIWNRDHQPHSERLR